MEPYKQTQHFARLALEGGESNQDQHTAVQAEPLQVIVQGDNFDKALKIFRSIVQKERVLSDYKEHQAYEKPSVKKRRKRAEARRKAFEAEHKVPRKKPQANE
jgi:small subunit ribosomal protein S21